MQRTRRISMKKSIIPLALALIMCLSLFPATTASAAQQQGHWAQDAVDAMHNIYGKDNFFPTYTAQVTVAQAIDFAENTLMYSGAINGQTYANIFANSGALYNNDPNRPMTRKEACALVFSILRIPSRYNVNASTNPDSLFEDCKDLLSVPAHNLQVEAIATFRMMGIVVGTTPTTFLPDASIDSAMLAALFYRTLRASGGEGDFPIAGFKPGQYGAWEAMYLRARGSLIDVQGNWNSQLDDSVKVSVRDFDPDGWKLEEYTGRDKIINAWIAKLDGLAVATETSLGLTPPITTPPTTGLPIGINPSLPNGVTGLLSDPDYLDLPTSGTLLEYVVHIVGKDIGRYKPENQWLFWDVNPWSPSFEGVQYLLNKGIAGGAGLGNFIPDREFWRSELAGLVYGVYVYKTGDTSYKPPPDLHLSIADLAAGGFGQLAIPGILFVVAEGYMFLGESNNFNPTPNATATQQDVAFAVYKLYEKLFDGDAANANLSVLDRFVNITDDMASEYKTAIAYLDSVGAMVGRMSPAQFDPLGTITRGEASVVFARVLQGVDTTKMQDYLDALINAPQTSN